jgi:hypothetical protein
MNRSYEEVATLYNSNITGVFSGGIVYEYTNDVRTKGKFGVVEVNINRSIIELRGFLLLSKVLNKTPILVSTSGYKE